MKVKIKKNAYVFAQSNDLREWLKKNEGKWFNVETKCLFNNQYNLKKYRVFDSMIEAVKDDARVNKGRCNYCGEIIIRGKEEEHFLSKENNKDCENCFWYKEKILDRKKEDTKNIEDCNGIRKTVFTHTYIDKYTKECTYENGCCNKECRNYDIEWFTEDNTYFLKYPNGLQLNEEKELLSIHNDNIKIGNYYLEIYPSLDYYRLSSARKTINFKFDKEQKTFYIKGIGYSAMKRLDIPDKINDKLIKILCER